MIHLRPHNQEAKGMLAPESAGLTVVLSSSYFSPSLSQTQHQNTVTAESYFAFFSHRQKSIVFSPVQIASPYKVFLEMWHIIHAVRSGFSLMVLCVIKWVGGFCSIDCERR